MQELYSSADMQQLSTQLKKRFLLLGLILCVFLAAAVWSFIARVEWAMVVSLSLLGAFAVFYIDLFCLPLMRYRKLLQSALSGRTHVETFEYARTEPETSVVDGVTCQSLVFLGEPNKHGIREVQYYWDAEHPLPSFTPGQQVTLKYTGKNIVAWQV